MLRAQMLFSQLDSEHRGRLELHEVVAVHGGDSWGLLQRLKGLLEEGEASDEALLRDEDDLQHITPELFVTFFQKLSEARPTTLPPSCLPSTPLSCPLFLRMLLAEL